MTAVLSAFLLSTDPQSLVVVKHTFDRYAVQTTTCRNHSSAFEALKQKRFDLFVLDFDLRGTMELFSSQTLNCLGRASNVIALTNTSRSIPDTLRQRARYSLQKPVKVESIAGILQSMYRLIFLEKRRYFRCAVRINASAFYQRSFTRHPVENAVLQDVSQTGLCLNTGSALPQGVKTFVDFQLPGTEDRIHVAGNVIWSHRGRTGIQFSSVSADELEKLRHWLNARCPWTPELKSKTLEPLPEVPMQHSKGKERVGKGPRPMPSLMLS